MQTKKILLKCIIGLSLSLGISSMFSTIKVNADTIGGSGSNYVNKLDPVWDGVPSDLVGKIQPPMASFNDSGRNQKNWYSNNYTNRVFLTNYKGFLWYSPVPPPALADQTSVRSYAQMYENANTWTGVNWDAQWTLADRSYPNFKVYSQPINDCSLYNLNSGNGYTNNTSPYKGLNGEWRYMGYSTYGNLITNPYFPSDVNNSGAIPDFKFDDNPWDYSLACPDGKSAWDDPLKEDLYKIKLGAIIRLLEQEPSMKEVSTDVNYWAKKLSLRTDPTIESGVFVGSGWGGTHYRTIVLKAPPQHNLRVVSEVVTNKQTGQVMGSFYRNDSDPDNYTGVPQAFSKLVVGDEYTVTVQVKNMSTVPTISDPSMIDVGYGYASAYNSTVLGYSDNQFKTNVEDSGIYQGNETKTFTWDLAFDESVGKNIRVTALIDQIHYFSGDNLDPNDDTASIPFQVSGSGGNFGISDIKLVDRNGVEQNTATPGQDYKIRYYVHYTGADIKIPIYRWVCGRYSCWQVFDHWYYPPQNIPLNVEIDRNIPPVHNYADVYKESIPKTSEVHSGWTYVYTTSNYRTYEVPVIRTTAQLSPQIMQIQSDPTSPNGQLSAEWHEIYDLSVSNVQIKPISETPYSAGYQTFAVQYTITNKTPSWLGSYDKDVKTAIALGNGQVVQFTDHATKGANSLITHEMKVWVDPKTDRQLKGTVTINFDRMVWEEDVLAQRNDQASATVSIDPPFDPYNGPPLQNTTNVWTQDYNIYSWTGVHKYYVDRPSQSFNEFTSAGYNNQDMAQNESYKITNIKFRSKLTTDTNQGDNGWVELTNPGAVGMIKSGYGYELQVTVNYNTNAFNQPQPYVSGAYSENGKWVRPYNVTPNLPNQLFVKTPDGQILSVDGYDNTNAGLDYTISGDRTNTTWVYSIRAKDTLGVKSAPKIYIDENTVDGTYNLQVFTPAINGVPTKTSGSKLCDSKTVQIKVQGSDTDDLKNHITQ